MFTLRQISFAGFLTAAVSIAYALYLQYGMGMEPCPLCVFQRIVVIASGLIFLVGFLINPHGWSARIYAILGLLSAGIGIAIAARHLWLQNAPKDQLPDCGPGLDYLMDSFPVMDVFSIVLEGSGECSEISWQFLGLTIPGWSMVLFVIFTVLNLMILFKPQRL